MPDLNQPSEPGKLDFLKIWTESFSRLAQAAFTFSPDSAPPEMMRQIRGGIFQALAQSWDEFLRSPQFMQSMKETMDSAIAFRKMSTDFLQKARQDTGAVGQEDFDALVLAVRHVESRISERADALSSQLGVLNKRLASIESILTSLKPAPASARPKTKRRRRVSAKG